MSPAARPTHGLPLVHVIRKDHVPSTGQHCPCVHLFYCQAGGSCMAVFDLGDDTAAAPGTNTPAGVNHIALRVDSPADLQAMRQRLLAAGPDVPGPLDHDGIRLELAAEVAAASVVTGCAPLDPATCRAPLLRTGHWADAGGSLFGAIDQRLVIRA